ncbi:hypothetical protein [Chryseobacterium indoltheticum]|uniref:hypothetical protein n=1 Tax=Chryseobacterium indoltheticum TaxID=254 RepID=UPI004041CF28
MTNMNSTKLSRKALKEIKGGNDLQPALICNCSGEALIMCPDGTISMTDYICAENGKCIANTGFCNNEPVLEPV